MAYLVADLVRTISLEPGDEILAGTPANTRPDVGAHPKAPEELLSTALGGDWGTRGIRTPQR